uniref:Uncharacterized protein n=1 Tax=Arundo donax TaxID=35708 RepID=A0A0A8XW24_ARUDO
MVHIPGSKGMFLEGRFIINDVRGHWTFKLDETYELSALQTISANPSHSP